MIASAEFEIIIDPVPKPLSVCQVSRDGRVLDSNIHYPIYGFILNIYLHDFC